MNKRLLLYLIPVILPIPFIQAGGQPKGYGFGIIGDPQCTLESQRNKKKDHIECILKIAKGECTSEELENREYAVAFPGDLIDGQDGLTKWKYFFWFLQCIPQLRKGVNQTDTLQKTFLKPLDEAHIPTMLGPGNHDFGDATTSSLELMHKRNPGGKLYYTQKFGKLLYVCCGVYPDAKVVLPWLKKKLAEKSAETPVVIAFHYNALDNHKRWWSVEDRQKFTEAIRGKKVQLIMHGHDHETYTGNIEGIPVVCAGGSQLPVALFDANGVYQKTVFLNAPETCAASEPVESWVRSTGVDDSPATADEIASLKSPRLVDNDYY